MPLKFILGCYKGDAHYDGRLKSLFEKDIFLLLLEGNAHCGGRMKSLFEKDIFQKDISHYTKVIITHNPLGLSYT